MYCTVERAGDLAPAISLTLASKTVKAGAQMEHK